MIIVVARADDDHARDLVDAWRSHGACLVTPADLTNEGWVIPFPPAAGSFVAEAERHETASVSGAFVRIGTVDPEHLDALIEADRAYAAAEITALLAYWLVALGVPIVSRPTPGCLAGPGWSTEEWITRAARLGLDTVGLDTVDLDTEPATAVAEPLRWVTVAGDRIVGSPDPSTIDEPLAALASTAHTGLLGAGFDGRDGSWRLARVSLCPPLEHPEVRAGLAERLRLRS